jgi:hypothetical protein
VPRLEHSKARSDAARQPVPADPVFEPDEANDHRFGLGSYAGRQITGATLQLRATSNGSIGTIGKSEDPATDSPASSIERLGFSPEEALLPRPTRTFDGYRLLRDNREELAWLHDSQRFGIIFWGRWKLRCHHDERKVRPLIHEACRAMNLHEIQIVVAALTQPMQKQYQRPTLAIHLVLFRHEEHVTDGRVAPHVVVFNAHAHGLWYLFPRLDVDGNARLSHETGS